METGDENHQVPPQFSPADVGAIAHLYRGEMYQSKIWRGRLDATTNWAVVVTGIALSATFAHPDASPVPMLLGSWLVVAFLAFEARRYLYYDVFRVRVRVMEINFYGPLLRGQGVRIDNGWNELLANDYRTLRFHIGYMEALGRRIRRNYGWLFGTQLVCYVGKLIVHPTPLHSFDALWERAAIGPIPGRWRSPSGSSSICRGSPSLFSPWARSVRSGCRSDAPPMTGCWWWRATCRVEPQPSWSSFPGGVTPSVPPSSASCARSREAA